LDLAGNLLSDWQSVGEILNVLANLQQSPPQGCACALDTLNLSWNRLGDYLLLPPSLSSSSSSSSVLTLSTTTTASTTTPLLKPPPLARNTTLTTVNLQACHIQRLETLCNLGRSWTHLQELVLAKCNLSNIVCCQQQQSLKTTTTTTPLSSSSSSSPSPPPPRVMMNQSQQETTTTRSISDSSNDLPDQDNNNHDNNDNCDATTSSRSISIDIGLVHFYQDDLAQHLPHLRRLDVSSCQLHSPVQVLVFAQLPRLESLSLDDNPALSCLPCRTCRSRSISMCNDDGGGGGSSSTTILWAFPALRHLQLAGTNFADWTTGLDDFFLGCRDCRVRAKTNAVTDAKNDDVHDHRHHCNPYAFDPRPCRNDWVLPRLASR
jgi:Leucine Rich repeat